jgi:site-specific DNA-methyltransferase (adenine-specific)
MPLRCHEDILVFYKKLPTYNPQKTTGHERKVSTSNHKRNAKKGEVYSDYKNTCYDSTERYPRSVLKFSTDKQKSKLHPTQKPVALMEYLIKTYTNESETVLDFAMGSGTTGVACKNLNRNFIGIEMDDNYFDIAHERINE